MRHWKEGILIARQLAREVGMAPVGWDLGGGRGHDDGSNGDGDEGGEDSEGGGGGEGSNSGGNDSVDGVGGDGGDDQGNVWECSGDCVCFHGCNGDEANSRRESTGNGGGSGPCRNGSIIGDRNFSYSGNKIVVMT